MKTVKRVVLFVSKKRDGREEERKIEIGPSNRTLVTKQATEMAEHTSLRQLPHLLVCFRAARP
jgi:hypothetical protein